MTRLFCIWAVISWATISWGTVGGTPAHGATEAWTDPALQVRDGLVA